MKKIYFDNIPNEINQDGIFSVGLFLDTDGETINAIDSTIDFSDDTLDFYSFNEGNSSINFWIEKPDNSSDGKVYFSGITPGGITGDKEIIGTFYFKAKKQGNAVISVGDSKILLNDGKGSSVDFSTEPISFEIKAKDIVGAETGLETESILTDKEPPEDFTPIFIKDDSFLKGKNAIVFSTQDKSSGIDRYEIKEGRFDFFKEIKSPYVLRQQDLSVRIYLKAIDRAENERLVVIEAKNPDNQQYPSYLILVILIGIIVLWLKRSKKRIS